MLRYESVLSCEGDFGKGREFVKAVDGVSFEVRKGEVFGIVGGVGLRQVHIGKGNLQLETPRQGKSSCPEKISPPWQKADALRAQKGQMVFQDPYAS